MGLKEEITPEIDVGTKILGEEIVVDIDSGVDNARSFEDEVMFKIDVGSDISGSFEEVVLTSDASALVGASLGVTRI